MKTQEENQQKVRPFVKWTAFSIFWIAIFIGFKGMLNFTNESIHTGFGPDPLKFRPELPAKKGKKTEAAPNASSNLHFDNLHVNPQISQ